MGLMPEKEKQVSGLPANPAVLDGNSAGLIGRG
jgi:hypothetical protein